VGSEPTIAETLPCLFREVLDALARLDELGARADAARLRAEAIDGYSRAWDLACQKRLERLLGRIDTTVRDLDRSRRLSVA
jgi:transcription initiation factor IIE alpha subunit